MRVVCVDLKPFIFKNKRFYAFYVFSLHNVNGTANNFKYNTQCVCVHFENDKFIVNEVTDDNINDFIEVNFIIH